MFAQDEACVTLFNLHLFPDSEYTAANLDGVGNMKQGKKLAARAVAFAIVSLFCFQAFESYFLSKADISYSCPHTSVWVSTSQQNHEISSSKLDGQGVFVEPVKHYHGDILLGCPGSLGGLVFAQTQPLAPAKSDAPKRFETALNHPIELPTSAFESYFPSLLQPPKS